MVETLIVLGWLVFTIVAAIFWGINSKKASRKQKIIEEQQEQLKESMLQAENLQQQIDQLTANFGAENVTATNELQRQLKESMLQAEHLQQQIVQLTANFEAEKLSATTDLQQQLDRFAVVVDAETEASNIRQSAQQEVNILRDEVQKLKENTSKEVEDAQKQASIIIKTAMSEAENIAGDALKAQGRVQEFERAVQALKNIVEGYGDTYIMPAQSLLDGLAEEFGFTEAGIKLKEARALTRKMIKEAQAATCDYVEEHRRKTAVAFVIDAFNGKVDSVLAKTKAENAGKLRQEIEDAFVLVNINGQAFRNARITEEYKQSRMEELHWGAAAVELREQEREEQRAIKERMREEERARREYEKAIREAARDESKLQLALEQARAELAKANEDQKARYEQQLADLSEKLQEAEARSQRALSMAQQTRSGYVYVISNMGSFGEDVFKIGMTRRLEPLDRVRELGDASVPFPFDVHAMIYSEDAPSLETTLHKQFNELRLNKVNPRKEFFRVALPAIRNLTQEMGVQANFTMLAQAQEYRESLAMERMPKEVLDAQLQKLLSEEVEEQEELEA